MLRREKEKTTALVLTAVIMLIQLVIVPVGFADGLHPVALSPDCPLYARLLYPFFHGSFWHAAGNCWALLLIVFYYNIGIREMLLSYLVAVTVPVDQLSIVNYQLSISEAPTVGLSAVIFCLFGQTLYKVKRKLYFHSWITAFIALGFCLPHLLVNCGFSTAYPNNFLHIYCYVVGLLVGFLNAPAPWQKK